MSFFKNGADVCEPPRVWNFSLLNWFPKEYYQALGKLQGTFFDDHWMYLVRSHRFAFLKTFKAFSYLKLIDLCIKYVFYNFIKMFFGKQMDISLFSNNHYLKSNNNNNKERSIYYIWNLIFIIFEWLNYFDS